MKITLGEFDRFWTEEIGKDWYLGEDSDDAFVSDEEEWPGSTRIVDFRRGSVVLIYQGNDRADHDAWDPYRKFVEWRKRQTTSTLVVEVKNEDAEALSLWLAERSGKIVGGAK